MEYWSPRPRTTSKAFLGVLLLCLGVFGRRRDPDDGTRSEGVTDPWLTDVRHGTNLFWAQNPGNSSEISRIVSIYGDPDVWIPNRTATTSYITAPNDRWRFMGLGFNFKKQTLYWSDIGNKKIQGLLLNGNNSPFTIFDGISNGVYSLALDWLTNNIYWADSLYNWIVVAPAVPDTTLFRIIVDTDLDHPMGLVVHPYRGLLFWSDWGAVAKIEKSDTTGNNRRVVVERDLVTPMGLVLDMEESRLYWVDRDRGSIESVDIFTSQRRVHFTVEDTQFVSIALYHDFLFVTDQRDNLLYAFNKKSGKHEVNFSTASAKPSDVIMYDSTSQKYPKSLSTSLCDVISCDHMCVSTYGGRPECVCASGYELQADGKSCVDDGKYPTPMFIYSIGTALCRFPGNLPDMNLDEVTLDTQCFLTNRRSVLALGANIRENTLYFAENATKTISKVKLSRGESPEIIIGGTGTVEGLSVDWIASNIYWSDSSMRKIMVAKTDGRFQRVLHGDRLDKPAGLVVDAVNRLLYWSDRGIRPRIERSSLDGSGRRLFVLQDLGSPIHLSIDYLTKRLFWTDSLTDRIESITLDGTNRQTVMSQSEATYFGIALFQDFVVWTETGQRNGIHAGLKHTGEKIRGIVHPGIGSANDVITFDRSTQPLAKGPCDTFNACQQLCLPGSDDTHRRCACAMGFQKGRDGTSCLTEPWYDNFLLFADTYQKQIYQMNTLNGQFKAIALSGHDNPISVDFDPIEHKIYWSDVAAKVLKRALLNGSEEEIVKLMSSNAIPDGIALDSVSRLLYYTDAGNKIIAAMTLAEKYHVTIIKRRLNKPRAIALDPIRGFMYWTDWSSRSRIEKAAMDGSDRKIIIDTGLGGWPNGITIDITGERLYWCNARTETIETSNLEGDNRKVLYRATRAHFFGITLSGSTLFYTDWTQKTIMKLESVRSGYISATIGQSVFARANDIHAYKSDTDSRVINQNGCSVRNGGCSHVCLPTPRGRKCACPDDMKRSVKSYVCQLTDPSGKPSGQPTYPDSIPVATPTGQPPIQYYTPSVVDDLELYESTSVPVISKGSGTAKPEVRRTEPTDRVTATRQREPPWRDELASTSTTVADTPPTSPPTGHVTGLTGTDQPITELRNRSSPTEERPSGDSQQPASGDGRNEIMDPGDRTSGNKPAFPAVDSSTPRTKIEHANNSSMTSIFDDRITYIGLSGILVGGASIMLVIITAAILVYKKSEPRKSKRKQPGDALDTVSSRVGNFISAYDMPLQDAVTSSHTSAERLAELDDNYFSSGDVGGLENPSFVRRDSGNTVYEEISGYSAPEPGSPTFITFAKTDRKSKSDVGYLTDDLSSPGGRTSASPAGPSAAHRKHVTLQTTAAHVHGHAQSGWPDAGGGPEGSEESSFSNPDGGPTSGRSSPAKVAPPVPPKAKPAGDDVTYATVARPKTETAASRIAAVIEKQYAQRR